MIELIQVKDLILLKLITEKNVYLATIGFLVMGLSFQNFVCNSCHDLTMLFLNLSHIAIITVKSVVIYCCIIHNISKPKATRLLENSVLMTVGIYKMHINEINKGNKNRN